MEPLFFESAETFRKWLERNHDRAPELLVGFYKRASGKPSMTWPESIDQALCFGWIDGVHKRIDDVCYTIRFTPRKKNSTWSPVNIRRAKELLKRGLMRPAGLRAFEQRREEKPPQVPRPLPRAAEKQFRANKKAWAFFAAQPPGYRRVVIAWVMSAKQEETRARRLVLLIDDSAHERRLGEYTLKPRKP